MGLSERFKKIKKGAAGQGMVEYGLILALVSIIAIGSLGGVGGNVKDTFSNMFGDVVEGGDTEEDMGGDTEEDMGGDTEDGDVQEDPVKIEIDRLVKEGYVPIATADELSVIGNAKVQKFGKGTEWEGDFDSGLDKKYVQVSDINLSKFSAGDGWNPITDTDDSGNIPFSGIYDGVNHKVSGLTINRVTESDIGLFADSDGGTFKNVSLTGVNVVGKDRVGGLVGYVTNSNLTNLNSTGVVSGHSEVGGLVGKSERNSEISHSNVDVSVTGYQRVGGLVGDSRHDSTVSDSYAKGKVNATYNDVGGLVGSNGYRSKVVNSYSTNSVYSTQRSVGGLVGYNAHQSSIENSYATGTVTGDVNQVGGLVGYQNNESSIANSYATGDIISDKGIYSGYVGGLVGFSNASSSISKSYATGNVTGSIRVGGLVGGNNLSNLTDSYATGQATGGSRVGGFVGYNYDGVIKNTYAVGKVVSTAEGEVSSIGLLMGENSSDSVIESSYFDKGTSKVLNGVGLDHANANVLGKSTSEMKDRTTYAGWDFINVWEITHSQFPTIQ